LAADFGWSIIKALIQRKLGGASATGAGEDHMLDPQQARIRTLLTIIQNITFAVILILAILTILSSIGIQIGPLIGRWRGRCRCRCWRPYRGEGRHLRRLLPS